MGLYGKLFGRLRVRILVVMLLMGTMTGILVGVFAYYIARSSIRDQVYDNLSNTARDVELAIGGVWIPTLEAEMRIIAAVAQKLYEASGGAGSLKEQLEETEGRIPGFKRVSVFLPGGYLLASSDPEYSPGRVEELAAVEAGESVIIPFRLRGDPPEEEKVMTVAVPVMVEGRVAAVLAGDIPPEKISGTLSSMRIGSGGEVYLVDGEGRLITIPAKAEESMGLEILGDPLDTEGVRRVTSGESGVAEYRNYAGERVLGGYIWMPEMGWGLMVEESADMAFSSLDTLRISVVLVVVALAVAALIASVIISRRLSQPLVALKTGAEKLGLGDLDYRVELKGAEELVSMASSFNRMAEAIQSSHEMMERKVRESTQELRALNEMITSLRRSMGPDEMLQRALELFMGFSGYASGWCYLVGDEGWRLLYRRCPAEWAAALPELVKPGEGVLGGLMERREALFLEKVEEAAAPELAAMVPQGSFAALPLCSPSRVLGLICLAGDRGRRLSGESEVTLKAMADETGIALENTFLYLQLQEHIAELERANEELRALDEMKSNFISAVSHELKQPLALIGGYAQTVHDYYDSLTVEEEMHCLRVIIERARFLSAMVEDLLDISVLEMGMMRLQREELDLAALARKVAGELAAGEEQRVICDFPPGFPTVTADARRMEQVFSNLLSNAVKFSGGKGEIRISGRVTGGKVQVRVEDEGIGIDPSQMEKIFERFYQVDASSRRPYPGVGLGLFICRGIIEAHEGRIWAENRPEGGSALVFEIPMAGAAKEEGEG